MLRKAEQILIILFFSIGIVGCGLNQTDNMEKELKEESCFQQDDVVLEDNRMNEMWEAYATIAEKYFDAQSDVKKGKTPDKDLNALYFTTEGTYQDSNTVQTFLVYDINKDGIPELFISRYNLYEKTNIIYDAYTWNEGKTIRFLKDKEIGYRSGTCDIRENGIILSFFSGSAWDYGFEVLQLPEHGDTVERKETVYACRNEENGNIFSEFCIKNEESTSTEKITEEEYLDYQKRYSIPKLNYTETSADTVDLLRKGDIKF